MKLLQILLLCLFFLGACTDHRPLEGILDEQKMVNVLADLSAVDGYMSTLMYTDTLRIQGKNYYATVYKNHNTSKAVFDKSMKYYSRQPVLLDSMYSKVTRKLDTKEKRLIKLQELEHKKDTLAK
ncbi:DUF4296 domain-containing protein [Daejeonella sp.]|uniref:DUF4296 domain-containing protein n=1 Tax=Daejeonella sp. TaxID=2805397 RepID=UPI0030C12D4C